MTPERRAAVLEIALERLGVRIRCEPLTAERPGGLCKLRGEHTLFVDPGLSALDRADVLAAALRLLDSGDIWLPPAIRALLPGE